VEALLAEKAPTDLIWIAVDASTIERPEAQTSQDRTIIHLSNLPLVDKAIGIGWSVSSVVLLPDQTSRWTPSLDQQRTSLEQTAIGVASAQLRAEKPLFGNRRVILLADRCYGTPEFLRACHDLGYSVLIRLKSNRKLSRVPVRTHKRGAPPRMGRSFKGNGPRPMARRMRSAASRIRRAEART
jgi:hypothetical protein